jgi:hypothetical protein
MSKEESIIYQAQNTKEHSRVFSIMGMQTILMVIGLGMSIFVAVSLGDLIKDVKIQHRITVTHFNQNLDLFAEHNDRILSLEGRMEMLEKIILER